MTNQELQGPGYRVETMEDIARVAPAVLTKSQHPSRSNRYSFLPTYEILDALKELNWHPKWAKQSNTPKSGGAFGRHSVRLENPDLKLVEMDGLNPQIIVDNSHNGYSKANIHMGLFRLVCTNGMVISAGVYDKFSVKHIGINKEELEKTMSEIAESYNYMLPKLNTMMDRALTEDEKEDFAIQALALREPWIFKEDGEILVDKVLEKNNIEDLLTPTRNADMGDDLWHVFNVIQEKLVNGGYARLSAKNKNTKTKPFSNPAREIRYNKELWQLADSYV